MNEDLVSIIIPTYNRAHLIGETLDSVIAQTYQNWECIVVDDGSADYTEELLEFYCGKDSRIQYHHRPQDRPKGANACRNYGFELSSGAYIQWFDDDDVMFKKLIQARLEFIDEKHYFIITTGYLVNESLNDRKTLKFDLKNELFKGMILWKNQIITNSVLFKREFLSGVSLFNTQITRGQEAEFFSRLFFKLNPQRYNIVDKPLFLYRQHQLSKSNEDKYYINYHRESRSYIAIENLKKAIKIKDLELFNYLYKNILLFYFDSIDNSHYKNAKYILIQVTSCLKSIDIKVASKFLFFGGIIFSLKRRSYRIEKKLLNLKIKM
ncbi:glycosyltransferase family 2 protein [Salegentibacter sp. Hel_I_6]|uniref:glycosyltransferase family 2 protein n=1 Tax=Salegentibacter sp. Hel_I_6 TaxID=1250278 RepID=UPI00068F9F65|nr:glycosyltransferase family 2 protein [Salegentibacter sp. Hel_I_6]